MWTEIGIFNSVVYLWNLFSSYILLYFPNFRKEYNKNVPNFKICSSVLEILNSKLLCLVLILMVNLQFLNVFSHSAAMFLLVVRNSWNFQNFSCNMITGPSLCIAIPSYLTFIQFSLYVFYETKASKQVFVTYFIKKKNTSCLS